MDQYVAGTHEFEELYEREYPGLVGVATALSGDRRDAEDLVQDTMVKAFLHWKRLRLFERPGAWCLKVLTNACRSRWRARRTEQRYLARLGRSDVSEGPSDDVMAFWSAVRRLPTRPGTAVALYFAGDHTTAEVAEIMGVPEGTIRSDIARARASIMSELRG
jgi:RNA polymerase sigma-70 factor (ECF subfamily)